MINYKEKCIIYTFKNVDVTHLHIKWRAWLNAIGWGQQVGSRLAAAATARRPRSRPSRGSCPGRLRLKAVCVCWHGGHGTGSVRSAVVGAGTGHLPPSWTHAPVTNPRLGQTRDRCTRREVAGVRGANVGSRETTATAAVGPQCWAMRDDSVIGSRLKSTKLPELYRIVPADSLPRPPPPIMWLMLMVTGLAAQPLVLTKIP